MVNKMRVYVLENVSGLVISCLIVFGITTVPVVAQETPKLKIVVMAGDGATNNIKLRLTRELMVKVEDENDNPVAGASVLFMLPDSGAGGTFKDMGMMLSAKTNEEGIAAAQGFVPNEIVGEFKIQVQASHQGQVANTTITQTNIIVGGAAATGGISGTLLAIIIGGAAAAGVAVAVGVGGGGKSQSQPTPARPSGTIGLGGDPDMSPP